MMSMTKNLRSFLILFLSFLWPLISLHANQGTTIVAVGDANVDKDRFVFHQPYLSRDLSAAQKAMAEELGVLFRNNFSFYRSIFDVRELDHSQNSMPSLNRGQLRSQNISFVFMMEVRPGPDAQSIRARIQAHDVNRDRMITEQNESFSRANLREKGHQIADEIYKSIRGTDSIFSSKILFVSDKASKGTGGSVTKELFIMDFDGKNARQLTHHRGVVISPSISYDGTKVLYSLIEDEARKEAKRNVDLYILDLNTMQTRKLSSRPGINSGAIFMPGDREILLTLSHTGNANIYKMNLDTQALTRLTHSSAPDVDPSINRDGSLMTFLSGRSGSAMVYIMDPRRPENNTDNRPERISFVGAFNATPRFNPEGTEIVFSSWIDNRFDIFRLNSDKTGLARLTRNFGSNEDPTFSPDGQFVAFSSQRVISRTQAEHNIYIMDRDGDILGQVTHNLGNCITPRWSRPLKLR